MINVLELIDGGFIGGGQIHVISLVKSLNNKQFKPVIAASPDGSFKNLVWEYNFDFADIELPKLYRGRHLKALEAIINEYSIDIIHSHGGVSGMYARFFKKKYDRIKTVHTIHGIHYINSTNVFRKYLSLAIEQFLVPYTDFFICVSEADKKKAAELKIIDTGRTVVVRNGIDLHKFSKRTKNKDVMKDFELTAGNFIIGNISRFDFQKNQRFIIRNSGAILEEHPKVRIILTGSGEHLARCESEAKNSGHSNKFIFTGEVINTEDYYSVFDIFVFPSLWEGLPITLIEAMASGCCILASNIEANKELLEDGKNGLLFDTNSPEDYYKKLTRLMNDDALRNEFANNALNASKQYSEEDMTRKVEEIYLKILHQ